jgi:hypothetical protein
MGRHKHEAEHTQVLPFDRYSLAVDVDIAGAPAEDAATACTPRRRPINISFVPNIVMAVDPAENLTKIRKSCRSRIYYL